MNELFKKMDELIAKQDDQEFEFFIDNHQELLKEDPVLFISKHVYYYAYNDRVNKVLETINYYKNRPYISMTVEDLLNELKEQVEKMNLNDSPSLNKETLISYLKSNNEEKISYALDYLSKTNIRGYINEVQDFLLSDVKYKYKTLVLFMLIEQNYEDEIKTKKNGLIYTLIPSFLDLPFDTIEYQEEKRLIEESNEEIDVKKNAIEMMNIVQIKEFPDSFISLNELDLMKDIFIYTAKKFMLIDVDISLISKRNNISLQKIKEMQELIEKIIAE